MLGVAGVEGETLGVDVGVEVGVAVVGVVGVGLGEGDDGVLTVAGTAY